MQHIAVIGAGTMGAGIALAAACSGFDVALVEVDAVTRERAGERLSRDAQKLGRADALTRIQSCSAISEVGAAELAIEAVPEEMALKQRVFLELERQLGAQAILATNTSSLSVRGIAEALAEPSRLLGLHFFNPPTVMKLVEVIRTDCTDDAVVDIGRAFVQALGKTAVLALDTPGFIVNRVARPYYLQALRAFDRDVGEFADLDALARGIGFRMGPFELMDLIGLDVNLATSESIFERTGAARLEPVPRQRKLVSEGKLGRKTGQGFYTYESGAQNARPDSGPPPAPPSNADEIVVVLGFGELADTVAEQLRGTYAHVQHLQNDEELDQLDGATTIVFDVGDGISDRSTTILEVETRVSEDAVIFVDAYATSVKALAEQIERPERMLGYGILGSLERQTIVEIVDAERTDDDALALSEELFATLGKKTMLVGEVPGLFLGRLVAAIVNEAVYAVQEDVASAGDIDVAMRLGTNYPLGPVAWGREIGGGRIARILSELAHAEGSEFGPARALWVLDPDADVTENMAEEKLRFQQSALYP